MSVEPKRNKTRALPEHLELGCLDDVDLPVMHEPTSAYVEEHWLPRLGPTATFAYRRLGLWARQEGGRPIHTPTFGRQLGVSQTIAANSPLARAIHRLTLFHVAGWQGDVLMVRPRLWSVGAPRERAS